MHRCAAAWFMLLVSVHAVLFMCKAMAKVRHVGAAAIVLVLYVMLIATGGRYIFRGQSAVAICGIRNTLEMISKHKITWRFHFWHLFMSVLAPLCPKLHFEHMVCCQSTRITYNVHISTPAPLPLPNPSHPLHMRPPQAGLDMI